MKPPLIIAHRTAPPFAPENSLQGIRAAIEQGADGVEIDTRMTLDQRCYLMHDNTMLRTTGWPLPLEATPSFIARRRRLESGNETVPSLGDALDALPPHLLLAADVKTPTSILPLIHAVKQRRMQSRTLIWCSSALVVRFAVARAAGCEVAYYKDYTDPMQNLDFIARARTIGAHAVSLDWSGIDESVITAAHNLGLRVYSWHKQHSLTPEKIGLGLDGMITDYPARTRTAIELM
ncbi:MAG TPA: glycerophosphodiester phosphodiesterase family protein [Dehalococcoidia bacterium]|nr:glycerophosphodiester phosphodiesterase family protein [Dehalococcoidia bacterium]